MTLIEIIYFIENNTGPGGSWMIERNEHCMSYLPVGEWLDDRQDFFSKDERDRAIELNTLIALHWYKDTPVGSWKFHAADIPGLEKYVSQFIADTFDEDTQ